MHTAVSSNYPKFKEANRELRVGQSQNWSCKFVRWPHSLPRDQIICKKQNQQTVTLQIVQKAVSAYSGKAFFLGALHCAGPVSDCRPDLLHPVPHDEYLGRFRLVLQCFPSLSSILSLCACRLDDIVQSRRCNCNVRDRYFVALCSAWASSSCRVLKTLTFKIGAFHLEGELPLPLEKERPHFSHPAMCIPNEDAEWRSKRREE